MGNKKTLHGSIKWFFLTLQLLAVWVGAISVVNILSNMFVVDKTDVHYNTYCFDLFEQTDCFEETSVFSRMFRNHMDEIVTNVVISSQIGENGDYDGNYLIDIKAYAERKEATSDETEKIAYRLADLLKWHNHGMYFKGKTYAATDEFIKDFTDAADNIDSFEVSVLDEIFLPIDGISLEERASDYAEYSQMVSYLEQSVHDLGYNISFYNARKHKFEEDKTNLRYCFILTNGEELKIYSNTTVNETNVDEYFRNLGAYVIYDPENVVFDTNMSNITANYMQNELNAHGYVFDKASHVYIGIDTEYKIDDIYAKANARYDTSQKLWYHIGAGIIAFVVWLVIFAYLSVMAGRKRQKDGSLVIQNFWMDYIPIELYTTIFAGVCVIAFIGSWIVVEETELLFFEKDGSALRTGLVAVVLFISVWFNAFWYSVMRRFKAHIVLRTSLTGMLFKSAWKLIKKACRKFKKFMMGVYDNAGIITGIIVPMLVVYMINLLGGFISAYYFTRSISFGFIPLLIVLIVNALFLYMVAKADLCRKTIVKGIVRIRDGEMDYQLDTSEMHGENRKLAEAVNSIGNGIKKAVETSMKDERLKADLITNVSHDIKTPLTSIINYVDLLKREKIETEPVKGYIEVLDAKSQRLKQLTDDLVEASKISSGNIVLNIGRIRLKELLMQAVGEFSEKFEQKNLSVIENYTEENVYINADSARMWRVIENLFNNSYKYSLENTRIYIELIKVSENNKNRILLSIKNISKNPLCITPDELMERFIRGDDSRTTEGSGLGLSIAKNLVELQGGKMNIMLDGDLFKIVLSFDEAEELVLQNNE